MYIRQQHFLLCWKSYLTIRRLKHALAVNAVMRVRAVLICTSTRQQCCVALAQARKWRYVKCLVCPQLSSHSQLTVLCFHSNMSGEQLLSCAQAKRMTQHHPEAWNAEAFMPQIGQCLIHYVQILTWQVGNL